MHVCQEHDCIEHKSGMCDEGLDLAGSVRLKLVVITSCEGKPIVINLY
jgi:hypothetical protein